MVTPLYLLPILTINTFNVKLKRTYYTLSSTSVKISLPEKSIFNNSL